MKMEFRYAWDTAQYEIFDARLRRGSHGDGIAVAAQSGRDPEDVNFLAHICCRVNVRRCGECQIASLFPRLLLEILA
jgi:hypothetical protein